MLNGDREIEVQGLGQEGNILCQGKENAMYVPRDCPERQGWREKFMERGG